MIVNFKFNRFSTESNYDYMVIGDLSSYFNGGYRPQSNQDVLILDGTQPTNIWVIATWNEFDILFERKISYKRKIQQTKSEIDFEHL